MLYIYLFMCNRRTRILVARVPQEEQKDTLPLVTFINAIFFQLLLLTKFNQLSLCARDVSFEDPMWLCGIPSSSWVEAELNFRESFIVFVVFCGISGISIRINMLSN